MAQTEKEIKDGFFDVLPGVLRPIGALFLCGLFGGFCAAFCLKLYEQIPPYLGATLFSITLAAGILYVEIHKKKFNAKYGAILDRLCGNDDHFGFQENLSRIITIEFLLMIGASFLIAANF